MDTPGVLLELYATADAAERHAGLLRRAERSGASVRRAVPSVVTSLTQTVTPQGIVGVCRFVDVPLDEVLAAGPLLVVVLAQVRDPGNAGAVLRVADAAGANAAVLTSASVDPYNPKCVRASAGSLFHLPIVTGEPAERAVDGMRSAGLRVLGAHPGSPETLDALLEAGGLRGPTAWVFGNEAWGLPDALVDRVDQTVRVPIHGRAESLNLATAAAVCLYGSGRAQRGRGGCRRDRDLSRTPRER